MVEGLRQLDFLIGKWTGQGQGFGRTSQVEHTYRYILQDRFIHCQTRSIANDEGGEVVDVHEDWEIYRYDPDGSAVILRGFYSEGYVNVYLMEAQSEGELVFTSEWTEGAGGMRARIRLDHLSPDEYTMALDLAAPGKDFVECQLVHMKRES
jgi:hypothetical protein